MKYFARWLFILTHREELIKVRDDFRKEVESADLEGKLQENSRKIGLFDALEYLGLTSEK